MLLEDLLYFDFPALLDAVGGTYPGGAGTVGVIEADLEFLEIGAGLGEPGQGARILGGAQVVANAAAD